MIPLSTASWLNNKREMGEALMKTPNARKPYTDAELREVLSDAPTDWNAHKHARRLGRSRAAIKMLYILVYRDHTKVKTTQIQVRRIAREMGWQEVPRNDR
jgi:hypothetical protein